jgi:hypothetical protein
MKDVLMSVSIDFDTEHGRDIDGNVNGRHNTLQCARHHLRQVDLACDNWFGPRRDFGFSKMVPQALGSTNAYDAARDNLTSANEMIMLALAIQQR